jgi:acyl-CoA reductase-like NAD-dependent aldehyde dehydrogenase
MTAGNGREVHRPPPTSREDLDGALEELSTRKGEWVRLPIGERLAMVRRLKKDFLGVQDRWSQLSVVAHGVEDRLLANDREWIDIALINRTHSVLERSLRDIMKHGRPRVAGGYTTRADGVVVAHVYPDSRAHRMLYQGTTMEVWLEPGVTLEQAREQQAFQFRDGDREGRTALVLGAGNASTLLTSDTFHKMFHDLRVAVLKMNPVNSYLGPLLEEAYKVLIDRGYLRIVYGGPEEGRYLVDHPLVDEVHMTGSDRTFEAVVFGPGEEGAKRKAEGRPIVDKPVDGELGCITPWIVVPGEWSHEVVVEQSAKMAYWMMRNEGYLCFAPRVLVMWDRWPQREAFVKGMVDALSKVEPIKAYYPGSAETQREFVRAHPEALQIGGGTEDHIPWTVICDVPPGEGGDICFSRESFSGMVAETVLGGDDAPEFLARTVSWLNDHVWGTLSATLLVSEEDRVDPVIGPAVERAVADLRYGTVGINASAVFGIATQVAPWGGYPGSSITDIQSGNAKVANLLMLRRPVKTVIRAPFHLNPNPFDGTSEDLDVFGRKLAAFEANPSMLRLFGLYGAAKRSTPKL